MTRKVYLSIGSNIDREDNVRSAIRCLNARFGQLEISPVYESESVGFKGDAFFNLVVGVTTDLALSELNHLLKVIEDEHGRERSGPKFSSRSLDIDVVTYGDEVGVIEGVELPRPELFYNGFVLLPMIDLVAGTVEPKTGKPYESLVQSLPKPQRLKRIDFDLGAERLSI